MNRPFRSLTISSLLTVILLPLHIGGDIAFGFDKGGPGPAYVVVPGGLFFIWTLVMLGVAGGLSIILSIRGLLGLRARPS